jgi:hypothetical protein
MNFEKVRAGISTVADVGVFIGFIMVAFQLQQNTVALELQAKAASSSAFSASETTMIGDEGAIAFALSITDPAAMTDSQIIEVWTFHAASMQPAVSAFQAYKQNVLSRTDYLEQIDAAADYITTPFARTWWKHTKDFFPLEFAKDVDLAMSSANKPDMLVLQLEAIRRDLAE